MKRLILAAVVLLLTGCATQIQHGLDERDANEIVSVLVARGFDAKKVPEKGKKPTWAIELGERDATEAMRLLTELKLPRPQRLKTQTLAQSGGGLIDTPAQERLRQLEAQEGDIEESLETMDGVASASVELVVPPSPRPGQPAVPSKAAVLLRVRPEALERLTQQRAELRALVAAAVDGLKADDVVLVVDVVSLPAPPPAKDESSLRPLVVTLGVAMSALAFVLVLVGWRMRRARSAAPLTAPKPEAGSPSTVVSSPQAPPPVMPKPVINANLQKKVA